MVMTTARVQPRSPRRSRNGHSRSRSQNAGGVQKAVKAGAALFLVRLLLRRSVLTAIGLGTVAAWWVRRRYLRAHRSLWSRLF